MAGYTDPAAYWGVSPQTAATFPLGLRTSNNLFNIKYFPGAERNQTRWPGLLGPSPARDQGDPQMLFANPEDSGVAAAQLLRRKYDAGQRTPQQIIAGPSGWTPGRMDSANAVAGYAGVSPGSDLRLDTPEGMRRFLPALATQEHGTWARDKLFSDDLFDKIAERATGAQFASGDMPKLDLLNLETGGNAHRWPGGPKAPVAQPMTAPAFSPQGSQPMAYQPQSTPQQDESPFNSFLQRFQSPMTQQGLGLLLSAMQGGDLNAGLNAGAQRGNMALQQVLQMQKMRQEEARRRALEASIGQSEAFRNMSPADRAVIAANPEVAQQLMLAQMKNQMAQSTPAAQAELEGQRLQNQIRQRQLEKPMDPVQMGQNEAAARRAQIEAAGMDPTSAAAKAFIASGRMPREDQQPLTATDKKAILEADEMVMSAQTAIASLEKAMQLSKKAYTGPGAEAFGYATSFFGNESGVATEDLRNTITTNALQQLKMIFGGNPTEGERRILLDIQGSVNKAPQVREAIYNRAVEMAKRRMTFYQDRANHMRGGDYFKAQDARKPAPQQPGNGSWSMQRVD